jgi:cation transport regulator ChaB
MYYVFGKPKNLSDLPQEIRQPIAMLRAHVPIIAIDDIGFAYADVLRRHGFQITVQNDITDIRSVESYPIVICDIKGVGASFESRFGGAHVLAEIRKHYPQKYLIVYTGQRFDASFNEYFALCDASLKKDAESDEWVEALDHAIAVYTDPILQWKKARQLAIADDVAPRRLMELEDEYVEAVLAKKAPFQNPQAFSDLPSDVKAVLLGVASNVVFKLLGG